MKKRVYSDIYSFFWWPPHTYRKILLRLDQQNGRMRQHPAKSPKRNSERRDGGWEVDPVVGGSRAMRHPHLKARQATLFIDKVGPNILAPPS